MIDFDLERLGNVWRQRPDPAELEELKRSAELVGRRARWGQRIDIVSAVVIGAVVLLLVLSNPQGDTLIVGSAAILILLASQIRSRRLRQDELRGLTGTTEQMLDQSIERVASTLKRTRIQIVLMVPGIAFGLLVANLVDDRSHGGLFDRLVLEPQAQLALAIAGFLLLGAALAWLARSLRRTRTELSRLVALRDSYRLERDSAGADPAMS